MIDEPARELTLLNPAYVTTTRISSALGWLPLLIIAGVLEGAQLLLPGTVIVPTCILYGFMAFVVPARKYRHWGYDISNDRLRVVRGYLFYRDTVVPFGRIQHIDVDQGPIDRRYGLATLTVHSAGSHNSTVALPGLLHADALAMREKIRAAIRADML
jgi:uncharacterized protein